MNLAKKANPTKRQQRHRRKWMVAASALLFLVTTTAVAFLAFPAKNPSANQSGNSVQELPAGLKALTDHYMGVMANLNSTETKTKMASLLNPAYNQTDLFNWQQTKMTFENPDGNPEDPMQILGSGKGVCYQWSIVYVSACLSLGYQSRLVASTDTANWQAIHMWAEVYYNGAWVHVDPSDKVWNNPTKYSGWDWGKFIGSSVKVYAFEDGGFEEVTSNYASH
jgi:hypothetical protein